MSYQVLARKWRPKLFSQLVGQEHVVRALTNALDNNRLHHAYLFTGTRGVGKTTLARIFAKSLNCVEGVSSTPCGVCAVCKEIDEGRFADLLEVDAASRTKVEQTRELLDNVPYAPIHGRYKVYLIDEVHMFSTGSFNALLKTLEEPPPHVKFLLATTDPQKVPVTVLSRCLQFNLKRMPLEQIRGYLEFVLKQEKIGFDLPSLLLIARAADGSMRDGLSLLDQAIAYGGGDVKEDDVRTMLGSIDGEQVFRLLDALANEDAALVMNRVAELAERAPDFSRVLQEVLYLLHRISLYLAVPQTLDRGLGDEDWIKSLADKISPQDAQLYYQIGLIGRRDLPLAPDPCSGFEMVMLRMLAFRPAAITSSSGHTGLTGTKPASVKTTPPASRTAPASATKHAAPSSQPSVTPSQKAPVAQPSESPPTDATGWRSLIDSLRLGGMTLQLANNCVFAGLESDRLTLKLDPMHSNLITETTRQKLGEVLAKRFGDSLKLVIQEGEANTQTPAQMAALDKSLVQKKAEQAMASDPLIKAFEAEFDATLVTDSVKPRDSMH